MYAPATPEAAEWEGFGTGLSPSHEPIVLARKPPETTSDEVHAATGWRHWHSRDEIKRGGKKGLLARLRAWKKHGVRLPPPYVEVRTYRETRRALCAEVDSDTRYLVEPAVVWREDPVTPPRLVADEAGEAEFDRRRYRCWKMTQVAANVLAHGVGAIHVNACRVAGAWDPVPPKDRKSVV